MSSNKKGSAIVFVSNLGSDICSPFFDNRSGLYVVRQNAGAVLAVDSVGNTQTVCNTGGQPAHASFNSDGNIMYIGDYAHGAVLAYSPDSQQQELVVGVYEDRPLRGPSAVTTTADGDIFFTDSGAFGVTGLHNPSGSVFLITSGVLKPISLANLAYPSGIAVSRDKRFVYVAEMMQNRVLRFFQRPTGVYHCSVFCSFSGGVGPSCLCIDPNTGNLIVGHYEVKEPGNTPNEGNVYVLSPQGKVVRTITTQGSEISGLAVNNEVVYIAERSTGAILKFDL